MREGVTTITVRDCLSATIGGVWGNLPGEADVDVRVLRSTNYKSDGGLVLETAAERSVSIKQLRSRELARGDILLEKSGGGPNQPVGRVTRFLSDEPGFICANFVQLLRPDQQVVDPDWLFLALWQDHASGATLSFQNQTTGIRNLRTVDYLNREITVPPLPEQRRIADLMGAVDGVIEACEAGIAAAERRRTALLSALLHPTSGDEATLPEGWVVRRLEHIADVRMGQSPPGSTYNSEALGLPFLQGSAEFGARVPVPHKWCSAPTRVAEEGDLLFSVRAPVGDMNVADQRIAIGRGLASIRGADGATTAFLALALESSLQAIRGSAGGGMFESLTKNGLLETEVSLPPLPEQRRVADLMGGVDDELEALRASRDSTRQLRAALLQRLLSGDHEIPASYDRFITDAEAADSTKDAADREAA